MSEHKFLCALKGRDLDLAKKMLDYGVLSQERPDTGSTSLLIAIRLGHLKMLDMLLERRELKINHPIPLVAVGNDMTKITTRLIDAGADLEMTTDDFPSTPLLMAATTNYNNDVVRLLVERGANTKAMFGGAHLIHVASTNKNSLSILRYVVEDLRVPVDEPDENGDTALMYVAASGSLRAFKYLEESGANMQAIDRNGFPAIFRAAQHDNPIISSYLICDKNWDPNITVFGSTCVQMAGTEGTEEAIKNAIRAKQAGVTLHMVEPAEPTQKLYQEVEGTNDIQDVDYSLMTMAERAFFASDAYKTLQISQNNNTTATNALPSNRTLEEKTSFGWLAGNASTNYAVEDTKTIKGTKDTKDKDCCIM